MVKIGRTRGTPEARARALSSATGVPTPFFVLSALRCRDEVAVEQAVHVRLARHRVSGRREFFAVAPSRAAKALQQCADRRSPASAFLRALVLGAALAFLALLGVAGFEGGIRSSWHAAALVAFTIFVFMTSSRTARPARARTRRR